MAFAAKGDKNVISNTSDVKGCCALDVGFPPITQKLLKEGGIAPTRKDFNGVFHLLSLFALYQQSGGNFNYDSRLDYKPFCMVVYQDTFYVCLQEHGAGTAIGVKQPEDTIYWKTLYDFLGIDAAISRQIASLNDSLTGYIDSKIEEVRKEVGSFQGWTTLPGSGTADSDGILCVIGMPNTTINIMIDGATRAYVDRRDKYGQGQCSATVPIKKGSTYWCGGASLVSFMPMK